MNSNHIFSTISSFITFRKLHKKNIFLQTIVSAVATLTLLINLLLASSSVYAQGTVYTPSQWDSALSNVIDADVAQSVTLPNGNILWIFGDTTQVNGVATCCTYGYPHDAFVTQTPGTLTFTAVPGSYGYGWQQVPNWSDGTFFWMATPIVYNGTLYVLGERISTSGMVGDYVAEFNANTLVYENIVQVPDGATGTTQWGGVAVGSGGWWITGTHQISCTDATDCKVGDIAYVPFGQLANPTKWTIYNNVIPATANLGTTLAMLQTNKGWDIFTKEGDEYGTNSIERLNASSVTGTWTVTDTWPAPYPSGTVTYGVAVHPEQASPTGDVLVSYNVNGGASTNYSSLFEYLPK